MDKYNYYPRDSCSPSFSSTILDSIYHSIDQTHDHQKHYKASEKVVVRRKSAADSEKNSGSSNCGSSACFNGLNNRPKPIRTSISADQENFHKHQYCPKHLNFYDFSLAKEKTKHQEDGFVKTKSRALKIYRNLKKVKQPISPGGRLSSFLNSLFTNSKKSKISSNSRGYENEERKLKSTNVSTCSSASSFSRSCLIVDDQDCHKNNLYMDKQKNLEKNRRVEEASARDLRRNCQYSLTCDNGRRFDNDNEEEEYDDDDVSCASSDLFELDNLSSIGMELPVYETTKPWY
uniref:Protein BIG GRAIN 1-like B n=1 Tax=Nicotiana tabacum TaxID=4097 RepID=A0A1S3XNI5_TOBAC|nr:PREDICTED: protein BIG GRAIN 1-like B [Nicotiana tabacum]